MISRTLVLLAAAMCAVAWVVPSCDAFAPRPALAVQPQQRSSASTSTSTSITTALGVFGKKKLEEDLSYIETRDMTRKEMIELNQENEKIMNAELWGMTGFSLVISIPMLYLVWVAFFSETAGDLDLTDAMM
jgi:hypothetical protein